MGVRAAYSSNFYCNVVRQDGEGRFVSGVITDTNRESIFGQSIQQGADRAPFSLNFAGNHFPHFVSVHHTKNISHRGKDSAEDQIGSHGCRTPCAAIVNCKTESLVLDPHVWKIS